MKTNTKEYQDLVTYGKSLVGKTAQSRLLTMISSSGKKVMEPPQKITGFEIVEQFMNPTLMVIIDGETIFEEYIINIR